MVDVKRFDSNLLKIYKKSYKNIDVYYTGSITMKTFDYVKISGANSLNLIIDNADRCINESNGNKYLLVVSTDKNKEVFTNYTDLWNEVKNLIEKYQVNMEN